MKGASYAQLPFKIGAVNNVFKIFIPFKILRDIIKTLLSHIDSVMRVEYLYIFVHIVAPQLVIYR